MLLHGSWIYKWFMNVRLFYGQTIYLSVAKSFHNYIIKDLRHFLALFVGQKSTAYYQLGSA